MRVLVCGLGSIGKRHARNLAALGAGEVVGFDPREDRRAEAAAELGIVTVGRLDEAWEREPQVAFITAPTSLHVPLATEAAAHGCHLFVEKPLSDSFAGVDALLETVRARGLVTLVGCNLRFHPGLVRVKRLIDDGAVGRVVAARIEVGQYLPDWHPYEDYRQGYSARRALGGGVILDAIHELDYARWLLGEVARVAAFAGTLSDLAIETEDVAAILLRFASGAIGEVHLDYVQRAYSRTCHVVGTEGTIRWAYTAGAVRWYTAASGAWQEEPLPAGWEPNQMYVDELKHFLACLRSEQSPALDVFGAARVLAVALAARQAAEDGTVVPIGDAP
ncbi:MAG TPA: Gfo/Idh/MocA family oxidoreductase [Chloroflexota bacterium]|jgi:predicted dehydrogenase